jgi:hypothetical protein
MAGPVQPQAYFRLLAALDPGAGADEVGQLRILTSTAVLALPGRHHDAGYPPDERADPPVIAQARWRTVPVVQLARASAASPRTTWCLTVTDDQGHAIGHGCARPEPGKHPSRRADQRATGPPGGHDPPGPGFTFTAAGTGGPPGGYGSWRFTTGIRGQPALVFAIDPIAADECDRRFEARGHDPGVKLRHLSQIRHALCTGPMCRRPSARADFEHNTPHDQGGRSCLCNGGPPCKT